MFVLSSLVWLNIDILLSESHHLFLFFTITGFVLTINFSASLSMVNLIYEMWHSHKAVDEVSSLLMYYVVNILH